MAKYEKGRRCLVLKCEVDPKLEGHVVVLDKKHISVTIGYCSRGTTRPGFTGWTTDPPHLVPNAKFFKTAILAWEEKHLMPLDDPDLEEQIRQEQFSDVQERSKQVFAALDKINATLDRMQDILKKMAL